MRIRLLLFLVILTKLSISQNLKNDLQGKWICDEIVNSDNIPTNGKFGTTGDYLQFYFNKGSLSIIQAPFDRNVEISYDLSKKDSIIDLFPSAVYELPERKYKVISLANNSLVLKTTNVKKETIFYYFTNQNKFLNSFKDSVLIDYDTIVIKHLRTSDKGTGANKVSQYFIHNNQTLYYPTPSFNDWASSAFGFYLSINFVFPENFAIETITNEMIVEFDVTKKGAENIEIIKGISNEIDSKLLSIITDSRKKWKPVEINDKIYITKNRFHIIFYLGKMQWR